jgi:hypothetical protein
MVDESIVAQSQHPLKAWEGIFRHMNGLIKLLGSRMRRCKAVLNRLCVHTEIMPFLEEIKAPQYNQVRFPLFPLHCIQSSLGGRSQIVRAPMWLSEVHTKLVNGFYDSEFEFAFDVRLVWENCKTYNTEGSELWNAAHE